MDEFNYLSVLISIILGLSITQVLTGFGRLMQVRARVRMYWPPVVWAGLLLVIDVETWWTMFGLRSHHDWNFFAFLVVLLQPIILYLLAALVLPDFAGEAPVDLRANYYGHTRWFFGLAVSLLLVSLLKDRVINGSLPEPYNLAFHLVTMATWVGAAVTRREWYHKLLVPVGVLLIGVYIAVLFARLPT
jgi:hypothetical protein